MITDTAKTNAIIIMGRDLMENNMLHTHYQHHTIVKTFKYDAILKCVSGKTRCSNIAIPLMKRENTKRDFKKPPVKITDGYYLINVLK